jgi:hypothetical protein
MQDVKREAIQKAVEVMNQGGVILYPTDTVWGLGCDATNSEAVKKIYQIKRRADSKAMLCLCDAIGRVDYYFENVPEIAWDLWEVADKPLTLILPRARNVAPELIAEDGTMGMRITNIHAGHANMFLSPMFCKTLASITGATIDLYNTDGSVGAAKGAGIGAGIYHNSDEAFATLEHVSTIEPDTHNRQAYVDAYARWTECLNRHL